MRYLIGALWAVACLGLGALTFLVVGNAVTVALHLATGQGGDEPGFVVGLVAAPFVAGSAFRGGYRLGRRRFSACPRCGSYVLREARFCVYCRHDIPSEGAGRAGP